MYLRAINLELKDQRVFGPFFSGVCVSYNIELYLGSNKIELTDETSMLVANLMSLFNNFYAKITSQKVKSANRSKSAKGKTHGILPYGLGRDDENNYVEIKEQADVVREIFSLSKKGVGSWNIANILNDKGYPTKKSNGKWSGTTVDGILKNKIYKGVREFDRNNKTDGAVVSELSFKIIDPVLFDEVQLLRQNGKIKSGPKNKYNYLLTGKLICGHCENEMKGIHKPNSNTSVYRCKNQTKQVLTRCNESKGINITNLDNFILTLIFQNTVVENYLQYFQNNADNIQAVTDNIDRLKKDLKDLKTQKTKLLNLIQYSQTNDDEINKRYVVVNDNITTNEISLKQHQEELIKIKTHDPYTRIIENRRVNFKSLDKESIKKICSELIDKIKITYQDNDALIQITFKNIQHEIAYYHRLRSNVFRFLIPKDEIKKLASIEKMINNRVKTELSLTRNDSRYLQLVMDANEFEKLDTLTLDAVDDLSLEFQILCDEEELGEYYNGSSFDSTKFDVILENDTLLKFVE